MSVTTLLTGFGAGLVLGGLYLLGLWFTVRRATRSGNRGLLLVSFVARALLLMLAFYGLLQLGPFALIAALLGFIAARALLTRLMGPSREVNDDAVTR